MVAGQLARDLVLVVDALPPGGSSADARQRLEMLGGKGANQAVALAQLGAAPALLAVRGDDQIGAELLAQARRDGIDVSGVVCRAGALTGVIVEVLEADGTWRYLQHLPEPVLLTPEDVAAAEAVFRGAQGVLVQLQQPGPAALAAARLGRAQGALVVLDGAPGEDADRAALLAAADVVRTDDNETELLTGLPAKDPAALRDAVLKIEGPRLFALGLPDANYFVWRDGSVGDLLIPLGDEPVVDTTGGGDALTAALTVALLRGASPEAAARRAVAASGATVTHPGGRPTSRLQRTTDVPVLDDHEVLEPPDVDHRLGRPLDREQVIVRHHELGVGDDVLQLQPGGGQRGVLDELDPRVPAGRGARTVRHEILSDDLEKHVGVPRREPAERVQETPLVLCRDIDVSHAPTVAPLRLPVDLASTGSLVRRFGNVCPDVRPPCARTVN